MLSSFARLWSEDSNVTDHLTEEFAAGQSAASQILQFINQASVLPHIGPVVGLQHYKALTNVFFYFILFGKLRLSKPSISSVGACRQKKRLLNTLSAWVTKARQSKQDSNFLADKMWQRTGTSSPKSSPRECYLPKTDTDPHLCCGLYNHQRKTNLGWRFFFFFLAKWGLNGEGCIVCLIHSYWEVVHCANSAFFSSSAPMQSPLDLKR